MTSLARTRLLAAAALSLVAFGCDGVAPGRDGGEPDAGTDARVTWDAGPGCQSDEECDDGVACTADSCGADGVCRNGVIPTACDDGVFCNGVERCDVARGGCVPAEMRETCNDDDVCTIDRCDEEEDTCRHFPRDLDGDGDPDWFCEGGGDCDDSNAGVSSLVAEVCDDLVDNDCDEIVDEPACGRPPLRPLRRPARRQRGRLLPRQHRRRDLRLRDELRVRLAARRGGHLHAHRGALGGDRGRGRLLQRRPLAPLDVRLVGQRGHVRERLPRHDPPAPARAGHLLRGDLVEHPGRDRPRRELRRSAAAGDQRHLRRADRRERGRDVHGELRGGRRPAHHPLRVQRLARSRLHLHHDRRAGRAGHRAGAHGRVAQLGHPLGLRRRGHRGALRLREPGRGTSPPAPGGHLLPDPRGSELPRRRLHPDGGLPGADAAAHRRPLLGPAAARGRHDLHGHLHRQAGRRRGVVRVPLPRRHPHLHARRGVRRSRSSSTAAPSPTWRSAPRATPRPRSSSA
ncbi:MAG: putative metal-binding motif-containing protein [Sandaracinaceae bacterium]|nr:putative metal-binding motif-containing protein [Sandaracinaceae bacterium]